MAYLAIEIPEAGITQVRGGGTAGKGVTVEGIGNASGNGTLTGHIRATEVAKAHGRRKRRATMLLVKPIDRMIHAFPHDFCYLSI